MTSVEQWGALIFISIVMLVYLLAFIALVRILLKRFGYINKEPTRRQKFLYNSILSVALFGLMAMAYGYFIEPYRLTISRINIKSKKLPHNSRAIKVAHFSDLHCDSKKRVEDKLIVALNFEKPDLILFTGDTINGPEGLINAKDTFTQLALIAPTYVVKGNWDVWYWYKLNLFGDTGVKEIKGNEVIKLDPLPIALTGVPVGSEERIKPVIAQFPVDHFNIFLHHYPDYIYDIAKADIDLYCAGHTHGGQIALPLYGAIVTFSKFGKRFEAGQYQIDNTTLYVNRGLGMEGGDAPRVRFWAPPELTIYEISSAE